MANQPLSRTEELIQSLNLTNALSVEDVIGNIANVEEIEEEEEEQTQENDLGFVAALRALQIETAIQQENEQVIANESAAELTQIAYYDTKHQVENQNPYGFNTSTEVWRDYIDGIVNDMLDILPRGTPRTVEELDLEAKERRSKRQRTDHQEGINFLHRINLDEDDLSVNGIDEVEVEIEEELPRPNARRRLSFSSC